MDARGVTGSELARRTGFTAQYINSLRARDRGARLPLDTARRIAHALGVSVEWLTTGSGARERLSDVFPVGAAAGETPPPPAVDRYPTRGEAVALLATTVEPEVIAALRAVVPPDAERDPGREFWIKRARELAKDLRKIKNDPDLSPPPKSAFRPTISSSGAPPAGRRRS